MTPRHTLLIRRGTQAVGTLVESDAVRARDIATTLRLSGYSVEVVREEVPA